MRKAKKEIVALGYDQTKLKQALLPIVEKLKISIVVIESFKPERLHSSILNQRI